MMCDGLVMAELGIDQLEDRGAKAPGEPAHPRGGFVGVSSPRLAADMEAHP